jgi:hypothetical protein
MHNIKEINFEAIIILLKNIDYRDGTNNIKLCKGKNKLPVTFKEMFRKVKMIKNG